MTIELEDESVTFDTTLFPPNWQGEEIEGNKFIIKLNL